MTDIMKEFKELRERALKYDSMKGRYIEYGKKLDEVIASLTALRREISPIISEKRESPKEYETFKDELYQKMNAGIEVSKDLIRETHTELTENQIWYLFEQLRKMSRVEERRQNKKLVLYVRTAL